MGSNPIVSTTKKDPGSISSNSFQDFSFVSESRIDDSFDDNYERILYKDEIILMTYVFSFVSRYPEYNPFCFEAFETWRECDYYPISNEYPWDQYEAAGW